MKILIKGGRVVDPKNDFDKVADVLVDNGVISEIGENINADGDVTVIDAEGKIVSPGLVDMHSHLRDPAVAAGNEPEAHPPDAEWQADADPHKEVVTYAVRYIDRLEK